MRRKILFSALAFALMATALSAEQDVFNSLNKQGSLRGHVLKRRTNASSLNETEKKIIETEDELKRNPQDEKKWLELATLYDQQTRSNPKTSFFQSLDRTEETLFALHKAVECNPDSTEAMMRLGILDLQRGRNEEAKALFTKVTEV